jgi:small subunit ribosomal protein S20
LEQNAGDGVVDGDGGVWLAKRSKSGLKQRRQAIKRTARNRAALSRLKTLVKRAQAASPGSVELKAAVKQLDTAARKGIIHPNAAARSKSRLVRHLAKQHAASAP